MNDRRGRNYPRCPQRTRRFSGCRTRIGGFAQQLRDHVGRRSGEDRLGRVPSQDAGDDGGLSGAVERSFALHGEIERSAERPHVGRGSDRTTLKLLRRHEKQRSHNDAGGGDPGCRISHSRNPEVGDYDPFPRHASANCWGSSTSLTATSRSRTWSRPRHTRPMAPCPTGSTSKYRPPTDVPDPSGMTR